MADLRAARRYATALFNVALRQNELDPTEAGLNLILQVWKENPRLAETLELPQLPLERKRLIVEQLFTRQVNPLVVRFAQLLVEKRRVESFPAAVAEFQRLADAHRHLVRAQVTTATPLAADQAVALQNRLGARTGQTVLLEQRIDPAIKGGVIVRIGDQVMDGSVRGYLDSLRQRLSGAR